MRIRDYLEQASTRGVPDWLVRELPSRDSESLNDEWEDNLHDPKSAAGKRRLAAGMLQLRADPPARSLLGPANARALRWADSAVNRSQLAQQLRQAGPAVSRLQRLALRARSLAWRVGAGIAVIFVRIGVFSALDGLARGFGRGRSASIDRDD